MAQLLVQRPGRPPTCNERLRRWERCELRFAPDRLHPWYVFGPKEAFKNGDSSFFSDQDIEVPIKDVARLYEILEVYAERDRPLLLSRTFDKGLDAFFVPGRESGPFTASEFNEDNYTNHYRLLTQRYAVFNPFTGRGAIEGVKPHSPHVTRHIVATHVLKEKGSFLKAGYSIQDTEETTRKRYTKFLPSDKVGMVSDIVSNAFAF